MGRVKIPWLIAVAVVIDVAWWYAPEGIRVERSTDRNVLLLTIDTLRADTPGFAGGAAATPNLDGLARSGIWFDFAHAHAVVTLPSHASILTGQYPFAHGIRDNAGYRLRDGLPTLATILRSNGFATGAFVGAFPLDSRFGLNAGFDRYDDRYPETSRASDFLMPERPAEEVVDAAVRWISDQEDRWFAWVHVFDPHAPYQPPAPFDGRYRADPYAGEVAYTDHALGPLLAATARAGRPAVIVVTADHGEGLGDHREQTHGLFAYEATLRVPFVLEMPGIDVGRSQVPARLVDVLPTVLDALALEPPQGAPGRSLVQALEGRGASGDESYFEALTASFNRGWAPLTGMLVGQEKYIELPIPELYDLESDPGEQQNLLSSRPAAGRAPRRGFRRLARWAARPGGGPNRPTCCSVSRLSGTCRGPHRRRAATPRMTIPSGSSASMRTFTVGSRSFSAETCARRSPSTRSSSIAGRP